MERQAVDRAVACSGASWREHRLFPDAEVRRLQLRGSARLSRYLSRLSHQGLEAANAVATSRGRPARRDRARRGAPSSPAAWGWPSARTPTSTSWTTWGAGSGRDRFGRRVRARTARQRAPARRSPSSWPALVIAPGDPRPLLRHPAPGGPAGAAAVVVDELAPLLLGLAIGRAWARRPRRRPPSVSSGSPARCSFGAMGTAQHVLFLGCIPLGALGLSRFMRPLVSPRARVVAVICYLGLPLPYAAVGTGRWDGLVAYAAVPVHRARAWPGRPASRRSQSNRVRTGGRAACGPGRRARCDHRRWPPPSPPPSCPWCCAARAWAWSSVPSRRGARVRAGRVLVVAGGGRRRPARRWPWVVGTALAGKSVVADLRPAPLARPPHRTGVR